MDRYIGLDVHAQSCTVAVLSSAGKQLDSRVVETNGAALKQVMRTIPGRRHLCLEEGTQSAWIYELLRDEVDELAVIIPEKRDGPKSDARDAWQLADKLRTGATIRRVYKAQGPYSELRAAVRAYRLLRQDVIRTKNRLNAICRSRGLTPSRAETYDPENQGVVKRHLPLPHRRSLEMLTAELQALEQLWTAAEERVNEASKAHKIIRLLSTAPAIGPIRAAMIVAHVVTPERFRTKRQFWAYCGLAVVTRSSADWVRDANGSWTRSRTHQTRGLNKNRQPALKEVFKGAARQVVTHMTTHPLHRDYQRMLSGGVKPNLAVLTLARRIAGAVLAMWKHQEAYDANKHRVQITAPA